MNWKLPTALVGGLAVLFFGYVIWCLGAEPAISSDNYNRIQKGMTKRQVEIILGPPRWEVKPKNDRWIDPEDQGNTFLFPDEWWGVEGVIQIWYLDGRVAEKNSTKHRCEVRPLHLVEKLSLVGRWPWFP